MPLALSGSESDGILLQQKKDDIFTCSVRSSAAMEGPSKTRPQNCNGNEMELQPAGSKLTHLFSHARVSFALTLSASAKMDMQRLTPRGGVRVEHKSSVFGS